MTEATQWEDPFAVLSTSVEDSDAEVEARKVRSRRDRDSRICMCGHSVQAHNTIEGFDHPVCRAGKVICNCVEIEPVLKPQDARMFIRSTEGPREKHALIVGINRLREKGLGVEWITRPECFVCKSNDAGVSVVSLDEAGQIVRGRSGTRNKWLCDAHFDATVALGGIAPVIQRFTAQGF